MPPLGGPTVKIKKMTPAQRGYLAGAIDCDGSIFAYHKGWHRGRPIYPYASIYVTNTRTELVEWCRKVVGAGSISISSRAVPGRHAVLRWDVGSRAAFHVLKQIRQYLVAKREQADLLMELQRIKRKSRTRHTHRAARQSQIVAEVQALNAPFGH